MEKICVAVRVRPPANEEEATNGSSSYWKVEDNRISLHRSLGGTPLSAALSYTFGSYSPLSLSLNLLSFFFRFLLRSIFLSVWFN